jgi:hypothetical protein
MIEWIEHVRASGGGWIVMTLHHLRTDCTGLEFCMQEDELRALVAWLRTHPPAVTVRTMDQVMVGDPLVANPSMEASTTGDSRRPVCFRRQGSRRSFEVTDPRQGLTGVHAEIMRVVENQPMPEIGIDRQSKSCSLPVTVGRRYEVRAFGRAVQRRGVAGTATARMTVTLQTGGWWPPEPIAATVVGPEIPVGTEWTWLSFVTPPIPAGTTAMTFGVRYGSSTGDAPDLDLDDFSVVER